MKGKPAHTRRKYILPNAAHVKGLAVHTGRAPQGCCRRTAGDALVFCQVRSAVQAAGWPLVRLWSAGDREISSMALLEVSGVSLRLDGKHVDCKEIVRGDAVARATPVVSAAHPLAHLTHEAAIGSMDSRQLQTLMARGMSEEQAVDLIIQGLLSRKE